MSTAAHLQTPEIFQRSRDSQRRRLDAEFWEKTDRSTDCWEWTGRRQTKHDERGGYGVLMRFGRAILAHRYAYELTFGPIPAGMLVLHDCDNPPCIRPTHLHLGTVSDNLNEGLRPRPLRQRRAEWEHRQGVLQAWPSVRRREHSAASQWLAPVSAVPA